MARKDTGKTTPKKAKKATAKVRLKDLPTSDRGSGSVKGGVGNNEEEKHKSGS